MWGNSSQLLPLTSDGPSPSKLTLGIKLFIFVVFYTQKYSSTCLLPLEWKQTEKCKMFVHPSCMLHIQGHVHSIRVENLGYFHSPLINHITPLRNYTYPYTQTHTQAHKYHLREGVFLEFFLRRPINKPNLTSSIMSINSVDKPIDRAIHCSALETVYLLRLIKFYLKYLDL